MLNPTLVAMCADVTLPAHPTARDPRTGAPLRALHVFPSGRVMWPVLGGDGTGDGSQGGEGGSGGGSGSGSGSGGDGGGAGAPAAGIPQDQVNAIVARETEKAKQQALQSLADEWGVSLDEAKDLVKRQKDADAAKLTEAEKREQAAKDAEQKANDREAAAAQRERDATIRSALAAAGCTSKDDLIDASRLVELPDGDLDEKKADEAVEALKKRRPELFGGKGSGDGRPPAFTPPGAPGGPRPTTSMAEARKRIRDQREAKSA